MPESIRDQVLRLLMDNPNTSISGSELATKLHVTRSAVWKAVEGLRKDGFPIEAVTNRGYRLAGESGKISEGGIRAVLQSLSHSIKKENEFWIGWDIQVLDSAVSTNSLAKQEAQKGAEHGFGTRSILSFARQTRSSVNFWQNDGMFILQMITSTALHN